MAKWIGVFLFSLFMVYAHANEALPAVQNSQREAQMMRIASELRCLVCQNQTIADSHAELAVDLRQQVRELLDKGQTEAQIFEYLAARYGDFVLYRPPFKTITVLLWLGPLTMLLVGLGTLLWELRRRSRMAQDQFESDDADAGQDPHHS